MAFEILEVIKKHNKFKPLTKFLIGVAKLILFILGLPFILFTGLISLFKTDEKEANINNWTEFYSSESLKLRRLFIDEYELPEYLDYPLDYDDLYLFKLKSEPQIKDLEIKFFDYQFVEDEKGVYLISFNEKDKGMTLWYINNEYPKLEKVKDLQSSWWNFGKKDGKVILETTYQKKDIRIEIKRNS